MTEFGWGASPEVDVLTLCRPGTRPPPHVVQGIRNQRGVSIRLHVGTGQPIRSDRSRWETIARGRNQLKRQASASWAMFVDDDVLLHADCVRSLVDALSHSPTLGAIAADSAGEQLDPHWTGHVGMAACLFRRELLQQIEFRSTQRQCECWCCCDDLRKSGWGITYSDHARATHLKPPADHQNRPGDVDSESDGNGGNTHPVVLAAFDRRDIERFEKLFLHSLRAWGNGGRVIAVAYGLYPSELARIGRLANVHVVPRAANGEMAPVRRLTDFAVLTRALAPETPVAYWDVADVVFQSSLNPLWAEIARHPRKLLAVTEPKSYPHNGVIPAWSLSIHDPYHRRQAFELLKRNRFLNSGFAAGTASALHKYFDAAWRMRRGPELTGTSDWGDQMCLNVYCHSDPNRWKSVHQGWNYCVHERPAGEIRVRPDGIIWSQRIGKVPVAHGNARSLRQFSLIPD